MDNQSHVIITNNKFVVDQIEDISFDGEYYPTEYEGSDEDMNSDESFLKKIPNPRKKATRTVERLVINVSDTKYPVVLFVAQKVFKWRLQHEMDSTGWDLFWTDNAV